MQWALDNYDHIHLLGPQHHDHSACILNIPPAQPSTSQQSLAVAVSQPTSQVPLVFRLLGVELELKHLSVVADVAGCGGSKKSRERVWRNWMGSVLGDGAVNVYVHAVERHDLISRCHVPEVYGFLGESRLNPCAQWVILMVTSPT